MSALSLGRSKSWQRRSRYTTHRSETELVQARGGEAFTEYSLPEAILKLRQGVSRLIRTKTDRGIIVILDNRIMPNPYGRAVHASPAKVSGGNCLVFCGGSRLGCKSASHLN